MLDRVLDVLAYTVTRRRRPVLIALGLFVVFCGLQLPNLQTETSPENLIISYGGYHERIAQFQDYFGDTDSVVVLLVEAEDVTSLPALQWIHRLSTHFRDEPYVSRVESLTV